MAAALAAAVPILYLGLEEGGYQLAPRHFAGLGVWLVVVALLVLGTASRATLGRPFYWAAGSIGAFALWSALSSAWSGSVELSVIEADRVLVYLGFFLAAFLIAQTEQRRKRFAEGIAVGLAILALLGLGARLLPDVFNISGALGGGARMRFPLGYWNANGFAFAVAAMLALWMIRRTDLKALRWFSAAALPAILLALYFTFSRGGVLALLVGCGCLLALSHDRLWHLATLAIAMLGALPAVLAVQARDALTNNLDLPTTADQGLEVLLFLIAGTALALALFAVMRRLESHRLGWVSRGLEISRDPRVLKGVAAALAALAVVGALAVGGRAWDRFSDPDLQFPTNPQEQFTNLSGAGRYDFWRVALNTFGDEPVLGTGAGTYEFAWEERRSIPQPVHNAHSLYLEALSNLGLLGGLLVLLLVGGLLWIGFRAWQASSGARRETHAALLAVLVAFAVGAGIDWFWEIALLGTVFFFAGAILVAARCAQLAGSHGNAGKRGFGLALAGLALAWISALALIGPLLVDRELSSARERADAGDLAGATTAAESARSIEPWAASPYVELGLLAQAQGEYQRAAKMLGDAIEREDHNWQLYYLRARVEAEAGNEAAAEADLERATQLNPLARELAEELL